MSNIIRYKKNKQAEQKKRHVFTKDEESTLVRLHLAHGGSYSAAKEALSEALPHLMGEQMQRFFAKTNHYLRLGNQKKVDGKYSVGKLEQVMELVKGGKSSVSKKVLQQRLDRRQKRDDIKQIQEEEKHEQEELAQEIEEDINNRIVHMQVDNVDLPQQQIAEFKIDEDQRVGFLLFDEVKSGMSDKLLKVYKAQHITIPEQLNDEVDRQTTTEDIRVSRESLLSDLLESMRLSEFARRDKPEEALVNTQCDLKRYMALCEKMYRANTLLENKVEELTLANAKLKEDAQYATTTAHLHREAEIYGQLSQAWKEKEATEQENQRLRQQTIDQERKYNAMMGSYMQALEEINRLKAKNA